MAKAPRTDVMVLAAIGLAAALGIAFLIVRTPGAGADPLAAVPADSFMVVSIDIAALAQSPLGEAIVGELRGDGGAHAEALLGVDSIATTCGFDPLPHLRAIAIAIPEGQAGDAERGDFGVAASGTLTKDALASCAKAVIAKRGGQPTTRQAGSFTVVADGRSGAAGAEVAFRDGGPYLVGRGAWLARMMDAADGRVPSTLSAAGDAHAALRADLTARDMDAEAFRATALLPRGLRERLEHETALESSGDKHEGDKMNLMEGVLGVSAAALGVHAGRPHEDTRFVAELRCDSDGACDAVSTLILHTRLRWSGNLAYRMLGLGPLIDNLEVKPGSGASPPSLIVTTRAPADDLAKLIDRLLRPSSPPSPRKPKPLPPVIDEVFPARPDAGR
jgi:hypothetical protein